MVKHHSKNFLADDNEFLRAEKHWSNLWTATSKFDRDAFGWKTPWLNSERDGNPIFSAVSEKESKAIRVIQYEPTSPNVEIEWWMDTFGGAITDPAAIRELVISLAPSDESDQIAMRLMEAWIVGEIDVSQDTTGSNQNWLYQV